MLCCTSNHFIVELLVGVWLFYDQMQRINPEILTPYFKCRDFKNIDWVGLFPSIAGFDSAAFSEYRLAVIAPKFFNPNFVYLSPDCYKENL